MLSRTIPARAAVAILLGCVTPAPAQEPAESGATPTPVEEVVVYGRRPQMITPLPGVALDEGMVSSNIQQATGEDIRGSGAVSTTQFMNEQLQSITVQDNTGNPFQQDVVFRGFSASPLVATPQGLSVYLDGVRVNEPFGQVINWDLIPLNAIDTLALLPGSNPLFGLNSLGGALSLTTKSGFSAPGLDISQSWGSWDRRHTQFSGGISDEHVGALLAINYLDEDGWRRRSPSEIRQAFARADLRGKWGQLTAQVLHADNELFGGGLIPHEDFKDDPSQIYTAPDSVDNELTHFWGTARADFGDSVSASALGYRRRSQQETVNGDFWDDWVEAAALRIPACDVAPGVPAAPNQAINGAENDPGNPAVPNTGVSGCITNGVLGSGFTEQDSRGLGLQLNWVTARNQLVFGATYDSDETLFEQAEQLAYILSGREVVADPDRTFERTTITITPPGAPPPPPSTDTLVAKRYVDGGCDKDPADPSFDPGVDIILGIGACAPGDYAQAIALLTAAGVPAPVLDIVNAAAELAALPPPDPGGRTEFTDTIGVGSVLPASTRPILQNRVRGDNRSMAVYFFDVFSITPGLHLSFGARYSHTRVTTQTENEYGRALFNLQADDLESIIPRCRGPGDPPPLASNVTDDLPFFTCRSETHTYRAFNPAVGIAWDARENVNLFANVSRGSRTPSAIELACARPSREDLERDPGLRPGCTIPTALSNDPFLPQVRSTTWELGTRGNVTSSLRWNLAAYRTNLSDDILFVSLGYGNRGVFDTFGRTRREGIELGLDGDTGRVRWYLNYSHVRATFESRASVINLSNSSSDKQTVPGTDLLEGEFIIEPGDTIPGVPRHALRAGIKVDVTPRFNVALQLIGQSWSYVRGNENNAHQPGGTDNSPAKPQRFRDYVGEGRVEGFAIVNLEASYAITPSVSAFLQVDNLLDKDFANTGQLNRNAFPSIFPNDPAFGVRDPSGFSNNSNDWTHSRFVGPGAPRALWIGLRYASE